MLSFHSYRKTHANITVFKKCILILMYSKSVFQGRNFLKWGRHAWLASAVARGMYEFVLLQIFLRSISIVTTNLNAVGALELLLYFFMFSASV